MLKREVIFIKAFYYDMISIDSLSDTERDEH
jgi:hypothetical protein